MSVPFLTDSQFSPLACLPEVLMLAAPASFLESSPSVCICRTRPVLSVLADLDTDCSGSALSV